jgi:DNA-3-methyladenine glycosylase
MPDTERLPRAFFNQPTLKVARELLGMRLVRLENGQRLAGLVIETEAYIGPDDLGCHARAGKTPRTRVMYGPPGHAYIYFTYGKHWLLNFVTELEGFPAAVLLRAIFPTEGQTVIAKRREPMPIAQWTNGPAKVCQALNLDGKLNGLDLCQPQSILFLEKAPPIPDSAVTTGPRVGLNSVPEPWKSIPWRFLARIPAPETLS